MSPDRWQEMWEATFRRWDHCRDELKVLEEKDRAMVQQMASPAWDTLPDALRTEYTVFHDELVVAIHQYEVRLTEWDERLRAFCERLGIDPDPDDEA
jgi:hypothetical protein